MRCAGAAAMPRRCDWRDSEGVAAQDAISALTNLGYGQPEAARAVAGVLQDDAHADVSSPDPSGPQEAVRGLSDAPWWMIP